MKIGYPIAVILAVLGLITLFTDWFGTLGNATPVALSLIAGSLVATMWQREHDRRNPRGHPHRGHHQ